MQKSAISRSFVILLSACLLLTFIAPSFSFAAIPGVPAIIDPTENSSATLPVTPVDMDQGMDMPKGLFVIGALDSSAYGIAKGPEGSIYWTEYSGTAIKKVGPDSLGNISMFSVPQSIAASSSQLFGLAVDYEGNLFYGKDGDANDGAVYRRTTTGATTAILTGISRPRQIVTDTWGNAYIALEFAGEVKKWSKATNTVTTVATGLTSTQGLLIKPDGTLYVQEYSKHSEAPLIGVGYAGGALKRISPEGVVTTEAGGDAYGIWRGRGLSEDAAGRIYTIGEGNAWDQGNSSSLDRFDPATGTLTRVWSGLDYATYSAVGADGRIYMSLARDKYLVAYAPDLADDFAVQTWGAPHSAKTVVAYGGSWTPTTAGAANLTLRIDNSTMYGTAAVGSGSSRVAGWVKVPSSDLPGVGKGVLSHPPADMPGMSDLPTVEATAATGTVRTAVLPLRKHVRSRWPLLDLHTAAADFDESVDAYLVYFEWTPNALTTPTPPTVPPFTPPAEPAAPTPAPAAPVVLGDGFEHGSLVADGWTYNQGVGIQGASVKTGSYAASLSYKAGDSSIMTRTIDTTGYSGVTLDYSRMTTGAGSGDFFVAEYYNGSTWVNMESQQGNSAWTAKSYNLSAAAANRSAFTFRFWTATSADPNAAKAFVDDVKVTLSGYSEPAGLYPHEYPDPAPLFGDDFQSGGFATGGWTANAGASVQTAVTYAGRLDYSTPGELSRSMDTTGYGKVKVAYKRFTYQNAADSYLRAEYYNGSAWVAIEGVRGETGVNNWVEKKYVLPADAANNPSFKLRFRTEGGGAGYAYIDDIRVIGIKTPAPAFKEGFESGGLTAGSWSAAAGAAVQSGVKYEGAYAARLDYSTPGTITKHYDTTRLRHIKVQYARMTSGASASDYLYAEYYNGTSWIALGTVQGNAAWSVKLHELPADASNNPDFRIRFRTAGGGAGYAYIDSIKISGDYSPPQY